MSGSDHDVEILNGLIASVLDSADGYEEAAQDAEGSHFDELFDRRFKQRFDMARALEDHVRLLGANPKGAGTLLASVHRAFTRLRSTLAQGDAALLTEVERGEAHLRRQFETALGDHDMSSATRAVVEQAWRSIAADHEEIGQVAYSLRDQDRSSPV